MAEAIQKLRAGDLHFFFAVEIITRMMHKLHRAKSVEPAKEPLGKSSGSRSVIANLRQSRIEILLS